MFKKKSIEIFWIPKILYLKTLKIKIMKNFFLLNNPTGIEFFIFHWILIPISNKNKKKSTEGLDENQISRFFSPDFESHPSKSIGEKKNKVKILGMMATKKKKVKFEQLTFLRLYIKSQKKK